MSYPCCPRRPDSCRPERNSARAAKVIKEVWELLSSASISPIIYEPVYEGLEQTSHALLDLEARKTWGKAIIRVRREDEKAKL